MRNFKRIAGAVLFLGAIGASVFGYRLYRASQRVPEFYKQALDVKPEVQAQAGRELELEVLSLQTEAKRQGDWEAVFTDAQINGWLASEMPVKFPRALPRDVHQPRVAIKDELAWIGCLYQGSGMSAVVSIGLDVRMTDEPNVLAVRVHSARAGDAPLPVKPWLKQISTAAARSNIPVQWTEEDGEPVALVTVPATYEEFANKRVFLETVDLRPGELHLAGHTIDAGASDEIPAPERRILGRRSSGPSQAVALSAVSLEDAGPTYVPAVADQSGMTKRTIQR